MRYETLHLNFRQRRTDSPSTVLHTTPCGLVVEKVTGKESLQVFGLWAFRVPAFLAFNVLHGRHDNNASNVVFPSFRHVP